MERKYIAQFKTGAQITEDKYRTVNPTLELNDKTTIEDIKNWFRKLDGSGKMQVEIIEIFTINEKVL